MTLIRIEPAEMEAGCRELAAQADVVSQVLTGVRAQCQACCLPADVAPQVEGGITTLERDLTTVRTELFLESMILAVRGILAIQGSAQAGELAPAAVTIGAPGEIIPEPGSIMADPEAAAVASIDRAMASVPKGGISMAELDRITGGQAMRIVGLTDSSNPFAEPSRGGSFSEWANSPTLDTDGDGVKNVMDLNPGRYDKEYTPSYQSKNPGARPRDV